METKIIEDAVEGIMNSEPMKRVLSVESTAVVTGRVGEYKGKFIQDVLQEALTSIADQSKRDTENEIKRRIGFMRQWLNEDRITDKKMVTNEELEHWLFNTSL